MNYNSIKVGIKYTLLFILFMFGKTLYFIIDDYLKNNILPFLLMFFFVSIYSLSKYTLD